LYGTGDHDIWYSPITGRNFPVDWEILIRHVANSIMKQAGIDYHFQEQTKWKQNKQRDSTKKMGETDRKMEENARQIRETDKKISKLCGRFGEMVEYMLMPNLLVKFAELGFDFERAFHSVTIRDTKNNIITEVDVTL
jgi:hypothetical protein